VAKPTESKDDSVYITVDFRKFGSAYQISIMHEGIGYRIAGPKYDGNGLTLLKHKLTARDRKEIIAYLSKIKD
jgi:hypothetical protein